jgi:hypothetical protein
VKLHLMSRGKRLKRLNAYRQNAFAEYDNIHVQWFEIRWAIWVLVETAETNKVIIAEKLNLFPSFFHLNVFRGKRVDGKDLLKIDGQLSVRLIRSESPILSPCLVTSFPHLWDSAHLTTTHCLRILSQPR